MSDPAPSGSVASPARACQSCAMAKSKCIPQTSATNGQCGRCFRIKKECIPTFPKAGRKRKPAKSTTTRTTQLQEKLDSIVSLLEAAKQPASQLVYLTPPENPEVPAHVRQGASIKPQTERLGVEATFNYDAERPSGGVSAHQVARPSGLAAVTTQREGRPSLHTSVDSIFSKDLEPSLAEAIELLCRFKTLFVQHFPFIVIPAAQSAQELRQDKPYLYRTIMMVAVCNQPVRQEAMGREILVEFSASLLLRAEKSIDLLQALLVYNAWHYYHFSANPGLTNILQLTLGLMFDLGLKAPRQNEEEELFSYAMHNVNDHMARKETRMADEQRAFLGCYFLASIVSLCFKKIDGIRYSQHVDTCCTSLLMLEECGSDSSLVAAVRLQCIIEKMQDVFLPRHVPYDTIRAPIALHVNAFQAELKAFKASLSEDIQQNLNFSMHYHNAEIHLYEPSIQKISDTAYGGQSFQRVDFLYACLLACQSFFDVYLKLSPNSFSNFSIVNFGQMAHALAVYVKLSLLDATGWDLQHIRQTSNVSTLLHQLTQRFEEASRTIDSRQQMSGTDAFSRVARKLRWVKGWYDKKMTTDSGTQPSQGLMNASQTEGFDMGDQFNFLDDAHWQDIIESWDTMPWES